MSFSKSSTVWSLVFIGLFFGASTVSAEDGTTSGTPDTFKFGLGAFFITNSETTLRVDSKDVPAGVYINLENQLGVKTENSVGRIDGYYRFTKNHRLDYGYYPIERRGTRVLAIDIPTSPPITVGTEVTTIFDTATYKLGYTYSFYHSSKVEIGLGAGLHATSYRLSIKGTNGGVDDGANITAPLPVVSFLLNYNITPDWLISYGTQAFFLQYDGSKGSLTDTSLNIEFRGFENISFGLGFNRVSFNVEFDGEDYLGSVENNVDGVTTYMAFYF